MLFKNEAEREFNVSPVTSPQMDALINKCMMVYRGHPPWVNEEDNGYWDVRRCNRIRNGR